MVARSVLVETGGGRRTRPGRGNLEVAVTSKLNRRQALTGRFYGTRHWGDS